MHIKFFYDTNKDGGLAAILFPNFMLKHQLVWTRILHNWMEIFIEIWHIFKI